MSTKEIRKQLVKYIETAEDKKIKAIYTMVEDEILVGSHWEDEEFVKEMDKRSKDFETGKVKGVSWEEVQKGMDKILGKKRKTKNV